MKSFSRAFLLGLVASLAMSPVATADKVGVITEDPPGGPDDLESNYKTAPMAESGTATIPLGIHFSPGWGNWAGVLFAVHILDATEVSVTRISVTGAIPRNDFPVPPRSAGETSFFLATFWGASPPQIMQTGVPVPSSMVTQFGTLTIHAKNTDPKGNSDVDLSVLALNIFHLGPGLISQWDLFVPSAHIWATSGWNPNNTKLPPPRRPDEPDQHWVHLDKPHYYHRAVEGEQGSHIFAKGPDEWEVRTYHIPAGAPGGGTAKLKASDWVFVPPGHVPTPNSPFPGGQSPPTKGTGSWEHVNFTVTHTFPPGPAGATSKVWRWLVHNAAVAPLRINIGIEHVAEEPALSQWGVIVFALLLLTGGTIILRAPDSVVVGAARPFTRRVSSPLFVGTVFAKVLLATLALAVVGLVAAIWMFARVSAIDIAGAAVCTPIFAYMVHLWIVARDVSPRDGEQP